MTNIESKSWKYNTFNRKINYYNFLGHADPQYAVIKPIWRVSKELINLKINNKANGWWNQNNGQIFDIVKGYVNDPDYIIQIAELSKNLLGG